MSQSKYSFGAILRKPEPFKYVFRRYFSLRYLPPKIDLRPVLEAGGFKVFDQGNQGSCTANAGCADKAYQEIVNQTYETPLSRAFLYYEERALHGWEGQDTGAYMEDIGKVLGTKGVCLDKTMPYHDYNYTTKPSDIAYNEALEWVDDPTQTALAHGEIKNALNESKPVRIGVPVPNAFFEAKANGWVPLKYDNILGGHALLVVGYDDNLTSPAGVTGHLIVLNSWGEGFGDQGYVYIPYEWMAHYNNNDNWTQLDVNPNPIPPEPPNPPNPPSPCQYGNSLANALNAVHYVPTTRFQFIRKRKGRFHYLSS